MRTRLIKALRETAEHLESRQLDYDWFETSRCNCGVLAQTLLGLNSEQLDELRSSSAKHSPFGLASGMLNPYEAGTWSSAYNSGLQNCSITDLPLSDVFRQLAEAGLSISDMRDLEFLSNAQVRAAAGLAPPRNDIIVDEEGQAKPSSSFYTIDFDLPESVVAYMRAWANLLEQEDNGVKTDDPAPTV